MSAAADAFTRFAQNLGNKIEPTVRHHLVRVYACLTATTFCAAIGAAVHLLGIFEAPLLSALIGFGLALYLSFAVDDPKTFYTRLAALMCFGFLTGNSIGPLLNLVIAIEPQVVVTALIGTVVVFVSLSCSALLADRGSFLFIGGLLLTTLSTMALFGLANIFIQSQLIYQAHLYVGLVVMAGFVLFDTQMIMEKRRAGSTDCIRHSMDLFFDLISMFRRLLIILTQKEEREQRRRKNK
ncbi:bax inhibitor 1 [Sitodiplosis mosellana]|uniref:bax inhibitor 1 n=1 Tax=Sitodiplosis mosellana TaxID=263140 RepID=UPI0024451647|nr:bax inhibitor 1 [Sitodiplosis mosellana]